MSMLGRYRKKGGFLQLLNLIETCGPVKQEKFLKMIEEEDPRWAEAIRTKMLSIKKIFSWDDNAVAEIAARMNDLNLSIAVFGLDEQAKEKCFKMLGHSRKRKVDDLIAAKTPNQAEISTVLQGILTEVRQMIDLGYLYLEKIDPTLVVEPDIEEKLGANTLFTMNHGTPATATTINQTAAAAHDLKPGASTAEIENIKKKMAQIFAENKELKDKLHHAETKLAAIRKIA
jgi:hypothetical protein